MKQNLQAKLYTAILFLPLLGFFVSNQTIDQHAYFLLVIICIAMAYICYSCTFESAFLNLLRKSLGCLSTSLLILILSAEVSTILIDVYKIDFCEQITFTLKMVLMLSNMEGNLELCAVKLQQSSENHVI